MFKWLLQTPIDQMALSVMLKLSKLNSDPHTP